YRRGFNKNPDSLPLAYRMAVTLSREDAPDAAEAWKRALALGPRSAPVRADYADWLLRQGRRADAAREARIALRLAPNFPGALRVLASRWDGSGLAAALSLEKSCRVSCSEEEFAALRRIAGDNPDYRSRFERVRPILEKDLKGKPPA
ncbi:MAG: hypothetical protein M3167_16925, partial [Acidobacteriota bacterium]|nr:hypothetical protein [Acidobacteriota bacterium]